MKIISLTKNKYTVVDDEDYIKVILQKWHCTSTGYAACRLDGKIVYLHRWLMSAPKGKQVDHINGYRLDNRIENLRIVTNQENHFNTKKNGYKGISWRKDVNKWRSTIMLNGKQISLGYFQDKKEAAGAYNRAARQYFGEYANLNLI